MPVALQNAHVAEGVARLIGQFASKPKIKALLSAFLARIQDNENDAAAVRAGFNVDTAADYQLDILGAIVGEPRLGRTDEPYRIRIKARIGINRSNGHPDEILEVMTAILGTVVTTREFYPAAFELYALITDPSILPDVSAIMRTIKPAGVNARLTYHPAGNIFAYDGGAATGYDSSAQYSSTID